MCKQSKNPSLQKGIKEITRGQDPNSKSYRNRVETALCEYNRAYRALGAIKDRENNAIKYALGLASGCNLVRFHRSLDAAGIKHADEPIPTTIRSLKKAQRKTEAAEVTFAFAT